MKFNRRNKALVLAIIMLIMQLPLVVGATSGNTYYISPDGSDSNVGTSADKPFQTIQKAASMLEAGDTCILLEGVYYGGISAKESNGSNLTGTKELPITFLGEEGKDVAITATRPVTGWTNHSGNIWKAEGITWGFGDVDRCMVFKNGEAMPEGRWPNLPTQADNEHPLMNRENYAVIDSTSSDRLTINDSSLSSVANKLEGAAMWCASGVGYWSYVAPITSQSGNSFTIENVFHGNDYLPLSGNIYYIYGNLSLVDNEGEWYFDEENKTLYYYTESKEGPENVEMRCSENSVLLQDCSYVTLDGINVRGGNVKFYASDNCTFKNGIIEALDYRMPFREKDFYSDYRPSADGFYIYGNYNTVENCEVRNMFGDGIRIEGDRNRVINNYVHDINFEHTYSDGIRIESGRENLISYNTVERTGRSAIGGSFKSCVISYNHLSDANRLSRDTGVLYFNNNDYENSEIHHNVIGESLNNVGMQYGLYLDSFTSSLIVYRNLIYGQETDSSNRQSLVVNPNSLANVFVNNTIVNKKSLNSLDLYSGLGDRSGWVMINNLFAVTPFSSILPEGIKELNTVTDADAWNDVTSNDYSLSANSKAIDSGVFVKGISEGYCGKAPDCGAFESGETAWVAGHNFSKSFSDIVFSLNTDMPYRNLVMNGGFDKGLDNWTGNAERVAASSWEQFASFNKNGGFSLFLDNGDSVSQRVSGLKPNTVYEVGGYGLLASKYYWKSNYVTNQSTVLVENVDFGNGGYDRICVGLRYPEKGKSATVTIRKDNADGEVLGSFTTEPSKNNYMWFWDGCNIRELTGNNNLHLTFTGSGLGATFGGIYLDDSDGNDIITFNVTSDNGANKTITYTNDRFDVIMPTIMAKTGDDGILTLSIGKSGGQLQGYFDAILLREVLNEDEYREDYVLENIKVTNVENDVVFGIQREETHKISGVLKNLNDAEDTVTVSVKSFNSDNSVAYEGTTEAVTIDANGQSSISLVVTAPYDADGYFVISLSGASTVRNYLISDEMLENQYNGKLGVFLKKMSLFNDKGELIQTATPGEFTFFEATLKNNTLSEIPMSAFLAIYNEKGALSDIMNFKRCITFDGTDTFGMGTILPENATLKLFVWNNNNKLIPTIEQVYSCVVSAINSEK